MEQKKQKIAKEDNTFTDDISVDTDDIVANAQENYFEHEKKHLKSKLEQPLVRPFGGSVILNAVLFFLYAGLAIPVILIFIIQTPSINEHLMFFDIPFEKIVLVYFLSGALLTYIGMFFLKTSMVPVIFVFFISIFCSFPIIYGLRHNMTIQMAITGIQMFSEWPVFVRPAHVMFECLIPFGMFIFIFLQIKFLISDKKNSSYAFLFAAMYLALVCIGGHIVFVKSGEKTFVSQFLSDESQSSQLVYQPDNNFINANSQTQQNKKQMPVKPDPTSYDMLINKPYVEKQDHLVHNVIKKTEQANINFFDNRFNEMSNKLDLVISAINNLTTSTFFTEKKNESKDLKSKEQIDRNIQQFSPESFGQAIKDLSQKVELVSRSIPINNIEKQKEIKDNQIKQENYSKKDLHIYTNAFTDLEKELKHISETVDKIIVHLNLSEAKALTP